MGIKKIKDISLVIQAVRTTIGGKHSRPGFVGSELIDARLNGGKHERLVGLGRPNIPIGFVDDRKALEDFRIRSFHVPPRLVGGQARRRRFPLYPDNGRSIDDFIQVLHRRLSLQRGPCEQTRGRRTGRFPVLDVELRPACLQGFHL